MIKYAQIQGGEELAAVLRALPDALAKNGLRATSLAGAKALQDQAYIELASTVRSGGPRAVDDVLIKQRRSPRGEMQSIHDVGPPSGKPWLRWLHDGTRAHKISARVKYGTRRGVLDVAYGARNTKVLASQALDKFFGIEVSHPGQPPRPWLLQAQFKSRDAVYRAMANKIRPALAKQAKRLVSTKYRNKQLRRIFS